MNSQPPSKELLSDRLAEFSHELHESQLLDLCELVDDAKDMEAEIERLQRERDESRAAEARWKQTCQRMSAGAAHEPPAALDRYSIELHGEVCGPVIRKTLDPNGEWVLYEDVASYLRPAPPPAVGRAEIQQWRDDALEAAARICDRYGLDAYGAAHDIRVLKSDYPLRATATKCEGPK